MPAALVGISDSNAEKEKIMSEQHSREEILSLMKDVPVIAVATLEGDKPKIRMMHYAYDEDFNIYLSTVKGEPKIGQMTDHSSISLLAHHAGANINEAREVEISGEALFIQDQKEREQALKIMAERSPVVKHLTETGNSSILECIKVVPNTVKFRIFQEVVQGIPPTVIEFH